MNPIISLFNWKCIILAFICNINFNIGVPTNLEEWETKVQELITIIEPEADLHVLEGHLHKLMSTVHEFPIDEHREIATKIFKILGKRLVTQILRAMDYCEQLLQSLDNFGRVANEEYLATLIAKKRAIILGLSTELYTFLVEAEHEQLANSGYKNEIYCANVGFEHAKNEHNKLVRGKKVMENHHRDGQIIDENVKCQEIAVRIKLSIMEGEMDAKIHGYSNQPIDGDGFMAFARDFLSESKELLKIIENLSNPIQENVRKNLKNLANVAQQKSKQLRQSIAQQLEQLVANAINELANLQDQTGKFGYNSASEYLRIFKATVRRQKSMQICTSLMAQMQIVGIIPRVKINELVKQKQQLAMDDLRMINEQKIEILKAFDFSFDTVGQFRRSLSIREHLQRPH
ncbi:hypothetical protein niasHT_017662 [Heterodera trifolii]|uniref:Uncharacterized protein n=1 Tax=Heterodera trifolii TaxID=157864 RepID=A0ABD2L871_9BILA